MTAGAGDDFELAHDVAGSRYEARVGGDLVAFADYRVADDVVVFPHTVVDQRMNGRGIGSRLIRFALDDVRARGVARVEPRCWFVAGWIDRHPDYADLLVAATTVEDSARTARLSSQPDQGDVR